MRPLARSFYARKTVVVARALLGCRLVRRHDDGHVSVGVISETEAYIGAHDLASHAARGRTQRTEPMFGPPGHAYVYFVYGMHWCFNVVTEREGHPAAVLVRALVPERGITRRVDGPARLCRALAIDGALNRHDLVRGETLYIAARSKRSRRIFAGPRIGVDYAGDWAKAPLRFWITPAE